MSVFDVVIGWDTTLVAPLERDLWMIAAAAGPDLPVLDRYAAATGVRPRPALLELYRVRWDLADLAVAISRFRGPLLGSADNDKAWRLLHSLVTRLAG